MVCEIITKVQKEKVERNKVLKKIYLVVGHNMIREMLRAYWMIVAVYDEPVAFSVFFRNPLRPFFNFFRTP